MSESVFKKDIEYIAGTYKRFPLNIVSGKGAVAVASDGKEYIDMGSGIGVNIFGYSDRIWADAVCNQANKLQHTSNLYYTEPDVALAELLCKKTGLKKVFFSNSGAEANECAIKVARKYAQDKKGIEYFNIITLKNSFHGRTLATLAATGQDVFHKDFLPVTPGFLYGEANNIDSIKTLIRENNTAAIMIECLQGEGGVLPLDAEFIKSVADIAGKEDILLIVDEVQTGNGRTGKLYSYMHYGINPDIITTAKGLGGGLPIGATLFGEKTCNVLSYSDHGSTFGGNPVCCAGAVSVINRIDEDLLKSVKEKSDYIFDTLSKSGKIKNVSGLGLMVGFEPLDKTAGEVVSKCLEKGVLCLTAKNKVRLLPPLNIGFDLLKKAIDIIIKTVEE